LQKDTKKEQLKRALIEERLGLAPTAEIYVKVESEDEEDEDQSDDKLQEAAHLSLGVSKVKTYTFEGHQVRQDDHASPALLSTEKPLKEASKKRKKSKKKKEPVEVPSIRSDDSDSDFEFNIPAGGASSKAPAVYMLPNRLPEIQEARLQLPVVQEEDRILETIKANQVTVLCGETGSGKTTQVPQFLYEAGYSHPESGAFTALLKICVILANCGVCFRLQGPDRCYSAQKGCCSFYGKACSRRTKCPRPRCFPNSIRKNNHPRYPNFVFN
jgi:ATP-dependent RNA helicase DHX37/DHR1